MIFRAYQNNPIKNKKRFSLKSIKIINEYPNKLSKLSLQKNKSAKLFSSSSFKSYRTNQNNYINYTALENTEKGNYLSQLSNKRNNFIIKKKSQQFKIVNDYLIKLQKNNASGNTHNALFNNKYSEEKTYNINNNKIQSFKSIFQKKYNKLINDIKEDKLETRRVYETDKENNLTNSNFDIFGSIRELNKKSGIPIHSRIQMLKDAKNSLNQMQKNSFNSFLFYKSMSDEQQISHNFDSFRNSNLRQIKPYNDISDRKPIIIKHFPKPKLGVPKFININKMKVFYT